MAQMKAADMVFEQAADAEIIDDLNLDEPATYNSNNQTGNDNNEHISEEGKQGSMHAGVLLEQPSVD